MAIRKRSTGFRTIQYADKHKLVEFCNYKRGVDLTATDYLAAHLATIDMLDSGQSVLFRVASYDIILQQHQSELQIDIQSNAAADICKLVLDLISEYHTYQQKNYIVRRMILKTINVSGTWFDLDHMETILGCGKRGHLASYYKKYGIKLKRIGKIAYTDSDGLIEILSRTRMTGALAVMKELGLQTERKIQSLEASVLEPIIDFINVLCITYVLQYSIGRYRIDMYLPVLKIAIEVDEMGHADRNQQNEKRREQYIRDHLTQHILRINPNESSYRQAKMLGMLAQMIRLHGSAR